jgi:hypothetical protein
MVLVEGAVAKFNIIVKICKYRGLHEEHYFIVMITEMHGAFEGDMDYFINECARFFHNR